MKVGEQVLSFAKLFFVVFLAFCCASTGAAEDRLAAMRIKYDERLETINSELDKQKQEVFHKYAASLRVLEKSAKQKGDLDALLGVRAEIERFQKERALAASDLEKEINTLMTVQQSCLNVISGTELEWATNISKLCRQYNEALVKEEKKLTAMDNTEYALAVRAERKRVLDSKEVQRANELIKLAKKTRVAENSKELAANTTFKPLLLEGFMKIQSAHLSGPYPTYRGGRTTAYWVKAGVDQELKWYTAKVPAQIGFRDAVFVWAGSNSKDSGAYNLYFNDKLLMEITSGHDSSKTWRSKDCEVKFEYVSDSGGNSGIYSLRVPHSLLNKGHSQSIRVVSVETQPVNTWIMVYDYQNVLNDLGK